MADNEGARFVIINMSVCSNEIDGISSRAVDECNEAMSADELVENGSKKYKEREKVCKKMILSTITTEKASIDSLDAQAPQIAFEVDNSSSSFSYPTAHLGSEKKVQKS